MSATDRTWESFKLAALSDDDLGYPNGASFVAQDMPGVDDVVWRNLREGTPTVIVTDDAHEIVLVPHPRFVLLDILDRVRSRRRVRVLWRHHGHTYGGLDSEIGRTPVSELIHDRELVGAH